MRLGLIGNPENRRVDFFRQACKNNDVPLDVLPWHDLLRNQSAIQTFSEKVSGIRIESAGENDNVTLGLLKLGGAPDNAPALQFGQIAYLKEQALGLRKALELASRAETAYQCAPEDIWTMTDKWESHLRFIEAKVSRPHTQLAKNSLDGFRKSLPRQGRLFLKPRWGSSASGLCAYRWTADREQLIAPIVIRRIGNETNLFNSLSIKCYNQTADIDGILEQLLAQEMICEDWVPKARINGKSTDLRILVINGQARHWTGRQSSQPITNLHLGNDRLFSTAFLETMGLEYTEKCLQEAEKAASCFPDALYAGVDILPTAKGPVIGEINAFGDLLPGLTSRGESTYEASLKCWLKKLQSRRS
ncbi:STM4014 family protein [Cerasicoccus arenae]|uniref:ATP-grasp fold RimK-type domain-containing protein n=1 Tax=Cerasicoccus arenae TaxID=424488 RepID=A0A8J3GF54_9BACT|nr:hypothetical protein GCM10007047_20510 [Cerasicoccus arenae]